MKLACEDRGEVSVVQVKGELAAEEVDRFRRLVEQRFDRGQVRDFVLDCSGMEFIDSHGLEALVWLQDRCVEQLGQMRLAGCQENVRTILSMTRLAPRFDCHDAVDAAIRSLR